LVALGAGVAVEGVVAEEDVDPDPDGPDCEVEGEPELSGAPLPGTERSLPVWEASPVCGCPADAADSGAVVVAPALTDAQ
jgi:hypothetical protein